MIVRTGTRNRRTLGWLISTILFLAAGTVVYVSLFT